MCYFRFASIPDYRCDLGVIHSSLICVVFSEIITILVVTTAYITPYFARLRNIESCQVTMYLLYIAVKNLPVW